MNKSNEFHVICKNKTSHTSEVAAVKKLERTNLSGDANIFSTFICSNTYGRGTRRAASMLIQIPNIEL